MSRPVFPKRHYRRFSELRRDVLAISVERRRARTLGSGGAVGVAFKERLMLAVTQVNGCRYCAYAHAKVALAAGVSQAEVRALAEASYAGAPADEVPALLYAQHWAETDAVPDPETRRAVLAVYGEEKLAAIELALQTIRIGNLLGNTADYALYRASAGRWGAGRRGRR